MHMVVSVSGEGLRPRPPLCLSPTISRLWLVVQLATSSGCRLLPSALTAGNVQLRRRRCCCFKLWFIADNHCMYMPAAVIPCPITKCSLSYNCLYIPTGQLLGQPGTFHSLNHNFQCYYNMVLLLMNQKTLCHGKHFICCTVNSNLLDSSGFILCMYFGDNSRRELF